MNTTKIVSDSAVITWRNVMNVRRNPDWLLGATAFPIMFVLLFAYVFGDAIGGPGGGGVEYREFLIAGIFAQTVAFNSSYTVIGFANDLQKGIIDRFRSLPINRGSVLLARAISSVLHSSIGVVVMSLTGLIVGWRIHEGLWRAILAYLLLIMFGFAMIWVGILVGSKMESPEAVNGVMFSTLFPVTFLANTFAPIEGMPKVVRILAEWNPISALVQAMRDLWGNTGNFPPPDAWPLQHPVLVSIGWSILISALVAPLALRAYNRRTVN